jgi:hypothetical protein
MNDILKTTDIIQLHKQLDEFALHHQQKGVEKVISEIKEMYQEFKNSERSASNKDQLIDSGKDLVYFAIINRFEPF